MCVEIPALCGQNAKFAISDDGMYINIKYECPEVMFKADSLFRKSLASNGCKLAMSARLLVTIPQHSLNDSKGFGYSKKYDELGGIYILSSIHNPKEIGKKGTTHCIPLRN